ncbi:MAG: sigma-70 family RNA polymerase sigma factor [Desulfomonilia bacterium]|nr:sigma-70 family RNA polymerase sigma factor [Desulfomonilia bacterium]
MFDTPEFKSYCKSIRRFTLLSTEQECELARLYHQGDTGAGQKIINANLRFVLYISRPYFRGTNNPLEIVQVGNLGLLKALDRFDPDRGVRFTSYAIWWIRATINTFIRKSCKVHTGTLGLAKDLLSLDIHMNRDSPHPDQWVNCITDMMDSEKLFLAHERTGFIEELLHAYLRRLTPRELFILKHRFFIEPPLTYRDIGMKLGISHERVRQLYCWSLDKLRSDMQKHVHTHHIHESIHPPDLEREIHILTRRTRNTQEPSHALMSLG